MKSLATDGEILPVEAKPLGLKIEVYGDSVTCGYAVESDDFYENFTTRTENGMKTYANYAANVLNADLSSVSAGGYPLYKSIYCEYNHPDNIPDMLSMAEFEYQTSFDHPWDNSLYVPDVAIIALGANDGSMLGRYAAGSKEYDDFLATFEQKYYDFIDRLYEKYPDTLIVISDEILDTWVFAEIADRVYDNLKAQGKKVARAKYNAYSLAKDRTLPGAGHPNKEMQLIAGHELAKTISDALGITLDDGAFWNAYK